MPISSRARDRCTRMSHPPVAVQSAEDRQPAGMSRPAGWRTAGSEPARLGEADPAAALDHGQEGRAGALMLVGAEARLGSVEDVAVSLDRLEALDERVD